MKTRLGSTKKGNAYLAVSFVLLAGSLGVVAAHARHKQDAPIYTTGTDVADPNQAGNIDAAVTQTQQLLTALQAVGYDSNKLPDTSLMMLSDATMAEDPIMRQPHMSSYVFPADTVPEQSAIACYTAIYARQNTSYHNGDTSDSMPSGYFIVGWKNGTVQKIAVSDVRLLATADGSLIECFPGMAGYDPALTVWGK